MWRRTLATARRPWILIPACLYGLYLLFGFFLVNPLAQKLLPWAGERMLASRLSAGRVDFNPLTLELEVRKLALADAAGAPLAGFDRFYVNVDMSGLARWAWQLRDITLEQPSARVEIRKGGASNWSALVARVRERGRMEPPSDSMVRLLIDRIRVADGDIVYIDANRPGEPFRAPLKPLGLELAAISTLPEDRGDYLVSARLPDQGATLRWKGDVALNPLASQGELVVEGARVERLLRLLDLVPALQSSGTLGATLHYRFAMLRSPAKEDVASLVVSQAQVRLQDFALAPRGGGAPLLQVPEARVADASFDSVRREIAIGAISLDRGQLAAKRDARGQFDWQALLAPAPAGATAAPAGQGVAPPWKLAVRGIRLAGWSVRFTDEGYVRPLGAAIDALELNASLTGELGPSAALVLGPLDGATGPVQLTSGGAPVAQLQRAALTGLRAQLPQQQVRIEAIVLTGARAAVTLDKEQRLDWSQVLQRRGDAPAAAAEAAAPPDVQVASISASDIALQFTDASTATPVTLALTQGRIALANVGLDPQRAIPLEAAFATSVGGRIDVRGSIVPGKPAGQVDLKVTGFQLLPFAPYVNRFARLQLHSGTAGTRGKLAFAPGRQGLALDYSGGFAVDDLAITEEDTGDAFLGWRKLSSQNVRITLGPDRLHVGELVAQDPFGKIIIFEDRTLNLQRMRRTATAPTAAPVATTSTAAPPAFPIAIDRLRITGAKLEFADLSLRPQFGARIHELAGVVAGLSTDPASSAQVELDGSVDEAGSARVRGTLQPFRATEATDLAVAFRNLEMTRLTPYSGKFAGRRIASGRLSVDLEYKIHQRQLAGANKFVVNRLRLGEAVDSPDATKLPLDLAIALLEDSNGVIDLDLPVSGSLDDPQFSYGSIVWKAIVNVLTKVVTAPFRALGALLGVDAEKMQAVGFDPGRSALLPPEQEKLKALAGALAQRPALKVTIAPGYDADVDRRALQEMAMRREAATFAGVKFAAGEDPGPVDVNNHKVQTWLEDRYLASAGKEGYAKLRAGFKTNNETVERLGRRFTARDSGAPSAFHAELLERLTRKVAVGDDALLALAQARAQAMRDAIVQQGMAPERVAIGAPVRQAEKDKQVPSALTLGATQAAPAASGAKVSDATRLPGRSV